MKTLAGVLVPLPRPVPRWHGFDAVPEYVIIGGLIFVRMTCPLNDTKRAQQKGAASIIEGLNKEELLPLRREGDDIILLVGILANPLNYGYNLGCWRVLKTLNGEKVVSLRDLYKKYNDCEVEFLSFNFGQSHYGYVQCCFGY